jgi:hypothetical protein
MNMGSPYTSGHNNHEPVTMGASESNKGTSREVFSLHGQEQLHRRIKQFGKEIGLACSSERKTTSGDINVSGDISEAAVIAPSHSK